VVRIPTAVPSPPAGLKAYYEKEKAKEKRREKHETERHLGVPAALPKTRRHL